MPNKMNFELAYKDGDTYKIKDFKALNYRDANTAAVEWLKENHLKTWALGRWTLDRKVIG